MKNFLAVYMGSSSSQKRTDWDKLDDATRKARQNEGIQAWMDWGQKNHAAIVTHGGPLGKTKKVGPPGVGDITNLMTGFVVVQAESHEAAARTFVNHPHFTIFPGDSVEVMEILPLPGAR